MAKFLSWSCLDVFWIKLISSSCTMIPILYWWICLSILVYIDKKGKKNCRIRFPVVCFKSYESCSHKNNIHTQFRSVWRSCEIGMQLVMTTTLLLDIGCMKKVYVLFWYTKILIFKTSRAVGRILVPTVSLSRRKGWNRKNLHLSIWKKGKQDVESSWVNLNEKERQTKICCAPNHLKLVNDIHGSI